MSSPPRQQGEGLGKSTPLVTVAGAPPNVQGARTNASRQQNLTSAAGNHPLAPPPPAIAQSSSEMGQSVEVSAEDPYNPTISSTGMQPPPPPGTAATMATMPPPPRQNTAISPPRPPPPPPQAQAQPPHGTSSGYPNPQAPRPPPNQYASPPPKPQAAAHSPSRGGGGPTNSTASPVQSLDDLVDSFLSGPSYRTEKQMAPLLRPPPLVNDDPLQCLRTLVERRAWGDVLQVATDMLQGTDSVHAPMYNSLLSKSGPNTNNNNASSAETTSNVERLREETAEIVALQCHAWLKLRRYSDLAQEIDRWNFAPFSEGYNADDAPLWVPWSLQIIAAESLVYTTDDPYRGTDELFALVSRIPDSDIRWKLSTYRALVNAFSRKREWRMAVVSLERILPGLEAATQQELSSTGGISSTNAAKLLENAYRTEVLSVQGRVLLQAGAVAEASQLFQDANTDWTQCRADYGNETEVEDNLAVQHVPAQLLVNEGLLCFAYSNYDQAIECFTKATDVLRSCDLTPVYKREEWVGPTVVGVPPHTALFNECINNMALCALYTCRMREAARLMERLVREDPTAFLTERVAFNLCTIYELGCDSTASARKKRVLQLVAKRFFLHDVGPESFRIN